jgi:hypothetical protein
MDHRVPFIALNLFCFATASCLADDPVAVSRFEEQIRPLLLDRCQKCHSGSAPKGGLRLDSAEGLRRGGESGPVIAARAEDSRLIQAIRHQKGLKKMPPDGKLSDAQIAELVAWVEAGAIWPKESTPSTSQTATPIPHWSFQPVPKVEPPIGDPDWSSHPIDRFIAAKWPEQQVQPVQVANERTLLRRVYFDLIGLPPQPNEVAAFLQDSTPHAFERVVDRLLGSAQYGERWGRYWLDVARYADTAGDNADYPVPEARLYRDYVIDSFNRDKPYDQFVREQLAGDILASEGPDDDYAEGVIATTFLGLSRRYATAPYEFWHLSLEDSIDTVGQAFMGLTLRCARCHDHKYDPITTRDYYGLYGIFESTQYPWAGGEEFASKSFPRQHFVPLVPDSVAKPKQEAFQARLNDMTQQIAAIERDDPLAKSLADLNKRLADLMTRIVQLKETKQTTTELDQDLASTTKQRDDVQQQLQNKLTPLRTEHRNLQRIGVPSDLPLAYAVREGTVRPTFVQLRGEPERKGAEVPRGAIAVLMNGRSLKIPDAESGRRQLAEWLTTSEHPLTARVMVNRIWQHHFGQGLVASPSNFGVRGARPTHPELLDWLAGEFVRSGWSIKAMHRLILSSKTWQLASTDDAANSARDPENRFYWRHDRSRLDAEAIRDAMMRTSGRLNLARPGTHPFPPVTDWGYTQHNQFRAVYPSTYRSVYLMTQRLQRHPFLALFDGPDPNTTTEKRTTATVPLQALYLMNSPDIEIEADAFARRLLDVAADETVRIQYAYELAFARPASPDEIVNALRFLSEYRQQLRQVGRTNEVEIEAWTSYARVLLTSNEFFYVD